MSETVEEFLQRKGGVGLLSVLHEGGKTYSEIESEVSITSDTISKRKDEALEIGLIDIQAARRNNRTVNEYHLTDFGEAVTERLAIEGVVTNYQAMRSHQRKVEEKTADVVAWLNENPSHFEHFSEVSEETLIDRTSEDTAESASVSGDRDVDVPEEVAPTADEEGGADDEDGDDEVGDDGRVQHDFSDLQKDRYTEPNEDSDENTAQQSDKTDE
jgi:DNA-binding HxlR family transcriptional regulator